MTRFATQALAVMAVCFATSAACFWAGHRLRTGGELTVGYNTTVDGEIRIEPPLTWAEFKGSPFYETERTGKRDVRLKVDEEIVDTDEGQLVRRTAVALEGAYEGGYKAYQLLEHVQEAIDAFPGHTFAGRLDCEGEEASDVWRVVVRDGTAVKVEPRIVWPDEDEAGERDDD